MLQTIKLGPHFDVDFDLKRGSEFSSKMENQEILGAAEVVLFLGFSVPSSSPSYDFRSGSPFSLSVLSFQLSVPKFMRILHYKNSFWFDSCDCGSTPPFSNFRSRLQNASILGDIVVPSFLGAV